MKLNASHMNDIKSKNTIGINHHYLVSSLINEFDK